jgi:hypothetical protein
MRLVEIPALESLPLRWPKGGCLRTQKVSVGHRMRNSDKVDPQDRVGRQFFFGFFLLFKKILKIKSVARHHEPTCCLIRVVAHF